MSIKIRNASPIATVTSPATATPKDEAILMTPLIAAKPLFIIWARSIAPHRKLRTATATAIQPITTKILLTARRTGYFLTGAPYHARKHHLIVDTPTITTSED